MAAFLPTTNFNMKLPRCKAWKFSLNPGPFNMKEHVLITVFANAGCAFGGGAAYAIGLVNLIKVFYGQKISFIAAWLLVITTQVLGYGWAGLLRKYVVEPAHMWWSSTLVQVSIFRVFHGKDDEDPNENKKHMSRSKFFIIVLACSFSWYLFPGYLFETLSSVSWICWLFPKSVTAHQLGSGSSGLGIGAFSLDWGTTTSYLFSPLIPPFFVIVNFALGHFLLAYMVIPISYWGFNVYNAKNFPILSVGHFFTSDGQLYNLTKIVNRTFEIDDKEYAKQGQVNLSMGFALGYGFGIASTVSTLSHAGLFYGKEIYCRYKTSDEGKVDVHTRLMKNYKDIPSWWFYALLTIMLIVSLALTIFVNDEIQMPFWGLILAVFIAFFFTLPISIIKATTNQTPGIKFITEYAMSLIYPGKPIANVCFKVYGYISMAQAISFLGDFKLGHYMKIPPRSMFLVQVVGTIIAGTINIGIAWYLLGNIDHICHPDPVSNSPWTCPVDHLIFDVSVIFGLLGPRTFGPQGHYGALYWFFIGGFLGPGVVWLCHKAFPNVSWIPLINFPVLLGAMASMPSAITVSNNSWILVGTIFNFFMFRYRKMWWKMYNYILSAGLDAGVAFMAGLLYLIGMTSLNVQWWGTNDPEHCNLARCPTAKGIIVDGCPIF